MTTSSCARGVPAALLLLATAGACDRQPASPGRWLPPGHVRVTPYYSGRTLALSTDVGTVGTGMLERTRRVGTIRVLRDGSILDYHAIVLERVYVPAHGNGSRWPRGSRSLLAWEGEDVDQGILVQGKDFTRPVRPPTLGERDRDADQVYPPDPEVLLMPSPTARSDGQREGTGGTARIEPTRVGGACDFGFRDPRVLDSSAPRVTCEDAEFEVSLSSTLLLKWRPPSAGGADGGPLWEPTHRSLVIPRQTVPGARITVYCNDTEASERYGCGTPSGRATWRHAHADSTERRP